MLEFLQRRLITACLTIVGVATVVFALIRLLPGDPAETMLARSGASPAAVAALRSELGLDQPLPVQYVRWWRGLLKADLGQSLFSGRPVTHVIADQVPFTVRLTLAATAWALLLGPLLGIIAAARAGSLLDHLAMLAAVGGATVPIFWSGLLLIWIFSVQLRWLPSIGVGSWQALLMPSLVLGYATAGPTARVARAALLEVLSQPYIITALGKGLNRSQILWRHAVRNALGPILAVFGLQTGFLLAGTVITETVFSRPGLGRLLVDAILYRDLPLVQGIALVTASTYVLVNLAVDIVTRWLDSPAGQP
jgi:peptide/nickel transport system permease protein